MAYEENITFSKRTIIAVSDLSTKQYYAIAQVAAGGDLATPAKAIDGILQDNPVANKTGTIAYSGVTKAAVSASVTITGGLTMLEVDTGGTLKPVASGIIVAKALESVVSNAAVNIIAVQLLPSNALQA
jgi:hypothetical protein